MALKPVLKSLGRLFRSGSRKSPLSDREQAFLGRFHAIMSQHQAESEFTTAKAAACMAMSRMHLNRRLRALTGQSTRQYMRTFRLDTARVMLSQSLPVGFIAKSVGFKNRSHFARAFKKQFGILPSHCRVMERMSRDPPWSKKPRRSQ